MEIEINGKKFVAVYNDDNKGSGCVDCEFSSYKQGTAEYCNTAYSKTRCINMIWERKVDLKPEQTNPELLPGMKYSDDKIKYTLIPPYALQEVARNLTVGLRKYAKNNWQKVPNAREKYLDALMRHLESYRRGCKYDPENHEPDMHELSAVIVNALFLLEFDLNPNLEEVKE